MAEKILANSRGHHVNRVEIFNAIGRGGCFIRCALRAPDAVRACSTCERAEPMRVELKKKAKDCICIVIEGVQDPT